MAQQLLKKETVTQYCCEHAGEESEWLETEKVAGNTEIKLQELLHSLCHVRSILPFQLYDIHRLIKPQSRWLVKRLYKWP